MNKALITTLFLSLLRFYGLAQNKPLSIATLKDQKLLSVLCNVDTTFIKSNDNTIVRIFLVRNKSGSAHLLESDEVSHRLIIAVSATDDDPLQKLYIINNIIYPTQISLSEDKDQSYLLTFKHNLKNKKVSNRVRISLQSCAILRE